MYSVFYFFYVWKFRKKLVKGLISYIGLFLGIVGIKDYVFV